MKSAVRLVEVSLSGLASMTSAGRTDRCFCDQTEDKTGTFRLENRQRPHGRPESSFLTHPWDCLGSDLANGFGKTAFRFIYKSNFNSPPGETAWACTWSPLGFCGGRLSSGYSSFLYFSLSNRFVGTISRFGQIGSVYGASFKWK